MNVILGLWSDLKEGKNIEFYLAILVAFLAGGMSFFGYDERPTITAIMLGALGTLSIASVRDRHEHGRVLDLIEVERKKQNDVRQVVAGHLNALISSGDQIRHKCDELQEGTNRILSRMTMAECLLQSKLDAIYMEPKLIPWDMYFKRENYVEVFFTYGRTWRHNCSTSLEEFVRRPSTTLKIILPNPQNQVILHELSMRFSKADEEFRMLIQEAAQDIQRLHDASTSCGATVELWYASLTPMQSLYRFGQTAIIALSSYKGFKGEVPHFVGSQGGALFKYAAEELDTLLGKTGRTISERQF